MLSNALAIFVGGGLGSLARFGVTLLLTTKLKSHLPWGTIAANALACIVLALVMLRFREARLEGALFTPFLVVGFCGGFSTFSTFSYETLELLRSGQAMYAVANVIISLTLCLFLIWALQKTFAP